MSPSALLGTWYLACRYKGTYTCPCRPTNARTHKRTNARTNANTHKRTAYDLGPATDGGGANTDAPDDADASPVSAAAAVAVAVAVVGIEIDKGIEGTRGARGEG